MKRYAIWDKVSPVYTPSGEKFSPEQWIERYPVAGLESVTVICSVGEVNGGIFDTLNNMVQRYENEGCDFSTCTTAQEKLEAIEAFEDERAAKARAAAAERAQIKALHDEMTATSLSSIAASMDYQNMMTLEDVEV
jgi:hypothetical protein